MLNKEDAVKADSDEAQDPVKSGTSVRLDRIDASRPKTHNLAGLPRSDPQSSLMDASSRSCALDG